jgi:hypothetical protein
MVVRVGFEKYKHSFLPDSYIDELNKIVDARLAFYNKMMGQAKKESNWGSDWVDDGV